MRGGSYRKMKITKDSRAVRVVLPQEGYFDRCELLPSFLGLKAGSTFGDLADAFVQKLPRLHELKLAMKVSKKSIKDECQP